MGFADALVRLGIPYDSAEGVEFGRKVMQFLDVEAKSESERLATDRGAFPEWAQSIWGPDDTCARDAEGNRIRPMRMLRNCNVTTVAPTGTISIIAGCSSGLEPLFAVAFMRNQAGVLMPDVNEDFVAIAKREGWYSDDLMERIAEHGHIETSTKCRRAGSACSSPPTRSRPSGTSACRRRSRSTTTRRFRRRRTSPHRHEGRRPHDLRARVRARVQGRHRVSRRLARQPGALDGRDGEGERAGEARASAARVDLRDESPSCTSALAENGRRDRAAQASSCIDPEAENLQRRQKRSRPDTLRVDVDHARRRRSA